MRNGEKVDPTDKWPWWTFSQVIDWIEHRNIRRVYDPVYDFRSLDGWAGDHDPEIRDRIREEFRLKLMNGEVESRGISEAGDPVPIAADEWIVRTPMSYEIDFVTAPYKQFLAKRSDVLKAWPEQYTGNRKAYDWGAMKAWALEIDTAKARSRTHLAKEIRARHSREFRNSNVPDEKTVRDYLLEWGWPRRA